MTARDTTKSEVAPQGAIGVLVGVHLVLLTLYALLSRGYYDPQLAGVYLPPEGGGITLLSAAYTVISVWCLWSWKRVAGSLFRPYSIFLMSALVFNGGQMYLEVAHLNANGMLDGEFSRETLVNTMVLVTLGIGTFHLGALIAAWLHGPESPRRVDEERDRREAAGMRLAAWGLLAVALPAWGWVKLQELFVVLEGGYIALYQQDTSTGIGSGVSIVADLLVPAVILLVVSSQGRRLPRVTATAIVVVGAVLDFYLGYRAYAVWPVVAYAWAYHTTVRRLPRALLLGGAAVLMVVVFPLVRAVRELNGDERITAGVGWDTYLSSTNPLVATLSEMGSTMSTVAHTLELVPLTRSHDHGWGYLYAATTVIPNVFGGVHPAVERGTASDWLVQTVSPWNAAHGGGLGFSFIAEAYLNFGWVGSLVGLAVIGFILGTFFATTASSGQLAKVAAAAIFLSFLSHYARGESYGVVRSLAWYTVFPVGLSLFIARWHAAPRGAREVALTPARGGGTGGEPSGHGAARGCARAPAPPGGAIGSGVSHFNHVSRAALAARESR